MPNRWLTEEALAAHQSKMKNYRQGPNYVQYPAVVKHVPPLESDPGEDMRQQYAIIDFCNHAGLPKPQAEHRFHPTRKWRFDYAWPADLIALEIEGGVWIEGRHNRGQGMLDDMDKYNAAAVLGWRILRYSPQSLGKCIDDLKKILS